MAGSSAKALVKSFDDRFKTELVADRVWRFGA